MLSFLVEKYQVRSISNQQYGLRVEPSNYLDTPRGYGPVIGIRKTDREICAPVGGKIGNYHIATFQNLDNLSSFLTQAQAFSVQNPYIKVLYCQKI